MYTIRVNGDSSTAETSVGALEQALYLLSGGCPVAVIYDDREVPLLRLSRTGDLLFENREYRSTLLDVFETERKLVKHITEWLKGE